MKKFEFNGDWVIKLNLEKFNQSSIDLRIIDQKNYKPDPSDEQLNTIEYLLENQDKVLEALCKSIDTINKQYAEWCGEDDWYTDNLTIHNLDSVFVITGIEILVEHKGNHAYIQFDGAYEGDPEHGLMLVLHKCKLIGFNQMFEEVKEIYSDLGDAGNKFRDFDIKHQNFGEDRIHTPLPKYGKYKPWQLDATERHFENLIRTGKNEEFIVELEKSNFDINFKFPFFDRSLLETAIRNNNIPIINYLFQNGADRSDSLMNCSSNQDTIKCLIENGISIDVICYDGMNRLGNEIKNFLWHISSLRHYKDSIPESTLKSIELSKEQMRFYIDLGANPNHIDKDGNDYKSIISKRFNRYDEEHLKKHKVYEVLEDILIPRKV